MDKPTIIHDPLKPVSQQILAQSILDVSRSMKRLLASGLNRKAIVVLIHDNSGLGKRDIELVLNNLEALEENYTR